MVKKLFPLFLLFHFGIYSLHAQPGISTDPDSFGITTNTCQDTIHDTISVYNTGSSDLTYEVFEGFGPNYDSTSTQNYDSAGAVTYHHFDPVSPYSDSISLTIRLNGDFDGSDEYADLYIEGNFIEQIPDGNPPNGTDIIVNYTFTDPNVSNWLSDGSITVRLENSDMVGTFVGTEIHEASIQMFGADWVSASVQKDTVSAGDTSYVPLIFTSTNIDSGFYSSNILLRNNDPNDSTHFIPATFDLDGSPQIALSQPCIQMDTTYTQSQDQKSFWIYNDGCDVLDINNITNSLSEYSIDTTSFTLEPKDSQQVTVTFSPSSAGTYEDTLNILNNDIDTTICLNGEAIQKPTAQVWPTSIRDTLNNCCTSSTKTFNVHNDGGSDLIFNIPHRKATFDGSGDYIAIDTFYQSTGIEEVTVEAWIKTSVDNRSIASYDRSEYWRLAVDWGGEIGWHINTNSGILDMYGSTDIDDGQWHHIAVVYDEGSAKIYVDGSLDASASKGTAFGSGNTRYGFIGDGSEANSFDGSRNGSYFNGDLDEVKVWDKALSQSEIQSRMNRSLIDPPTQKMHGYWNFDDSTANDVSGNGSHGYLRGDTYLPVGGLMKEGWFGVTTARDTVAPGDTATVDVQFNNCGRLPGTYNEQLFVNTNDPVNTFDTVNAQLTVGGSPNVALSDICLDLDSIPEYTTHKDTFQLWNDGCDTLEVSDITNNLSEYSIDTSQFSLMPDDTINITVTFSPTSPGTYLDTLNILNNDQDTTLCLSGKAYDGPTMKVTPDTLEATINSCCDSTTKQLTVHNTGGDDLTWNLSTGSLEDDFDTDIDSSQWSSLGPDLQVNTVCGSQNGNALRFEGDNRHATTKALDVSSGGSINFYLYIRYSTGGCGSGSCDEVDGNYETAVLQYSTDGGGSWTDIKQYDYTSYDSWTEVTENIPPAAQTQSTLFRWYQLGGGGGTCDNWAIDEVTISTNSFMSYDPTSDTTSSQDSTKINGTFKSCGLNTGTYYETIFFNSNDPLNSEDTAIAQLNVVGSPQITLSKSCMDLDSIMEYTTNTDTLWVSNTGCDTLTINNMTTSTSEFSIDTSSTTLSPGDSVMASVTFAPTSTGSFQDTISITNNDNDTFVCLSGEAYPRPEMSTSPDSMNVTLNSCTGSDTLPLTVYNNGGSPLDFYLTGDLPYDSTSTQFYSDWEDTTFHTFNRLGLSDSLFLTIKLSGDYSASWEYANLYIDSTFLGQLDDGDKPDGTEVTIDTAFGDSRVDQWLSDGKVTVWLENENVDGTTPDTMHQVRLQLDGTDWLRVDTSDGTVPSNDSSIVNVFFNSAELPVGTYHTELFTHGNDPLNPLDTTSIEFTVKGDPSIAFNSTGCMYLDSIMEYRTNTDTLWISNTGCDTLSITNMSTNTAEFSIDTNQLTILPYSKAHTLVTFSPTAPGSYTDTITFTNNAGDTTLCLTGDAYARPILAYQPDTVESIINSCCDSITDSFTVYNNGGSNLTYSFQTEFFDDFEDGLGNWTVNGNWGLTNDSWQGNYAITESPSGNYGNNWDEYITLADTLIVNDVSNCELSFYHKRDMECCCDYLYVQIKINGGAWQTLTSWNCNESWNLKTFDLSSYVNDGDELLVRFYFESDGSVTDPGTYIDNVRITGVGSIPPWLSLSPKTDTIAPGDSTITKAVFNSCGLTSGTYTSNSDIFSNDPLNSTDTITTKFTINALPKVALSEQCMYLDSIRTYSTHSDTLSIYNTGCDTLQVDSMKTATAEFSVDTSSLQIDPYDTTTVTVTFSPTAVGSYTDTLTIFNNDTDKTVCLSGDAYERPIIATDPDSITASINACCDSVTKSLKIYNNGGSQLDWELLSGSVNDDFDPGIDSSIWSSINGGFADSTTCGSISGNALFFDGSSTRQASTNPVNTISTDSVSFCLKIGSGGTCEDAESGEDVILEYSNDNGSSWDTIQIFDEAIYTGWNCLSVAIPNEAKTSATMLRWRQLDHSGSCCDYWSLDNINISTKLYSASPTAGTTTAGDSSTVDITFSSCKLSSGTYEKNIVINNNDPLNNPDSIPYTLTISGTPILALSDSCLDLDTALVNNTNTDSFQVINNGCDTLDVSDISTSTSEFSVSPTSFNVSPSNQKWVWVDFTPSSSGTFTDTAELTTNDGNATVCLTGVGSDNAVLDTVPGSFDVEVACNEADTQLLTIYNTGVSDLEFDINDTISWVTLSHTSDTLTSGDSSMIDVEFSGSGLSTGTYTASLIINSNDATNPTISLPITLTVTSPLGKPNAQDVTVCEGDSVPPLIADGLEIKWYSDALLTTLEVADDTFFTGDTSTGTYTYYATQTDTATGCESKDTAVTLTISSSSTAASGITASNDTVCLGDSTRLSVSGGSLGAGASWNWYTDSCGGTFVGTGDPIWVQPSSTTTYYVRAEGFCDTTTCVSDTITVITTAPQLSATDTTICEGEPTPPLIANGTNVKWYSNPDLTLLVNTGDTFNTGLTSSGTYNFYVTQTVGGCTSVPDTSTLIIQGSSTAPSGATASPDSICKGEQTVLSVSGGSLGAGASWQWYSVGCGDTAEGSGSSIIVSPDTTTDYFVRAEGDCDTTSCASVTVFVTTSPSAPTAFDTSACENESIPPLTATGSNIKWYSDAVLSTQVGSGNSFTTGDTAAGSYTYFATQTIGSCESPSDDATLTIYSSSSSASGITATDDSLCSGNSTTLDVNGGSLGENASWQWYSGSCGGTSEGSGSSITVSPISNTTYFARAEGMCDTTSCDSITIVVGATAPSAPAASDTTVCSNESVPDLTATGSNIKWYSDQALTDLVHLGSSFSTGHSDPGSYTYYVTQTSSGCESPATEVTLTINATPLVTAYATPSTISNGDTSTLKAFNAVTYQWRPDKALSQTSGSVVEASPSQTQTYIVTGTDSMGCSDTVHVKVEVGPTGISPNKEGVQTAVYPNPTLGTFTVAVGLENIQPNGMTIEVLNMHGQEVAEKHLPEQQKYYKTNFDLGYTKGVFFLRIHTSEGIYYRKVVVQN